MTERLRRDPGSMGMVSGVGMHMTKHVFGVYSTTPGPLAPPPQVAAPASSPVVAAHDGPGEVAAYSVVHGRDGAPTHALLVCDLGGGSRAYARSSDPELCERAESEEFVGGRVLLESVEVDGAFGPATVNRASARGGV